MKNFIKTAAITSIVGAAALNDNNLRANAKLPASNQKAVSSSLDKGLATLTVSDPQIDTSLVQPVTAIGSSPAVSDATPTSASSHEKHFSFVYESSDPDDLEVKVHASPLDDSSDDDSSDCATTLSASVTSTSASSTSTSWWTPFLRNDGKLATQKIDVDVVPVKPVAVADNNNHAAVTSHVVAAGVSSIVAAPTAANQQNYQAIVTPVALSEDVSSVVAVPTPTYLQSAEYQRGYSDGYRAASSPSAEPSSQSDDYQAGFAAGLNAAMRSTSTKAYDDGYAAGVDSGYRVGYQDGEDGAPFASETVIYPPVPTTFAYSTYPTQVSSTSAEGGWNTIPPTTSTTASVPTKTPTPPGVYPPYGYPGYPAYPGYPGYPYEQPQPYPGGRGNGRGYPYGPYYGGREIIEAVQGSDSNGSTGSNGANGSAGTPASPNLASDNEIVKPKKRDLPADALNGSEPSDSVQSKLSIHQCYGPPPPVYAQAPQPPTCAPAYYSPPSGYQLDSTDTSNSYSYYPYYPYYYPQQPYYYGYGYGGYSGWDNIEQETENCIEGSGNLICCMARLFCPSTYCPSTWGLGALIPPLAYGNTHGRYYGPGGDDSALSPFADAPFTGSNNNYYYGNGYGYPQYPYSGYYPQGYYYGNSYGGATPAAPAAPSDGTQLISSACQPQYYVACPQAAQPVQQPVQQITVPCAQPVQQVSVPCAQPVQQIASPCPQQQPQPQQLTSNDNQATSRLVTDCNGNVFQVST